MSAKVSHRRRAAVVMAALVAVVCLFIGKLIDIQVVRADEFNAESLGKRSVSSVLYGSRGDIVDAQGTVLAHSVMRYDVTMSPKKVAAWTKTVDGQPVTITVDQAAADIGAVTGQTPEAILQLVAAELADDPNSDYAYVIKGVDAEGYEALRALDVPWLFFEPRQSRIYPAGAVAGNLLGFTGSDGTPLAGIEYTANDCLSSTDGSEVYEAGADWTRIPGSTITTQAASNGGQTVLTINSDLQWFAQQKLAEQVQAVGGTNGMVTVIEVKTGKLLAVAEYPSVDPNNVTATPEQFRGSTAFTAPFEPGSTFKALTAAALLDAGAAEPGSRVMADYRYIAGNGADVNDSDFHGPTPYTLTGVLMDSSNTGISILGERLGAKERYSYLTKFGVGTATEVGFLGEEPGILHPWQDWDNQTTYATMFGQGLSSTAVQVASTYQALGNDGVRLPVRLVEGCLQPDGSMTDVPATEGVRVVSATAADKTVNMLESVVTDGWLSNQISIPGYRVAAKTGTAQQSDGSGGYSRSYLVSLAGLAPAEDPEYVVSVNIANPVTITSSAASAPVFQQVMSQVLKTYRVLPSTEPAPDLPTHY